MRERRILSAACASALVSCALLVATPARADDASPGAKAGSIVWKTLLYLPNRLFDLSDVVRVRVRVGTGWAVGARVTRYLPVFLGDYESVWLGLPGPRGRARIPWPAGSEKQSGVGVGTVKVGSHSNAPVYGVGEVGAGVMVYMVGFDVGIDLYELVDCLAGITTVDLARDDF